MSEERNGRIESTGAARRTEPEESAQRKRMRESFSFFGPTTLLYAVFYTFCMYHNSSGVTFLFFILASIVYLRASLRRLELPLKRGSAYYIAAMVLLAISTFCTDDGRIIRLNKLGIFLLVMSLLLKQFYDTSQWALGTYLGSILRTAGGALTELETPFRDAAGYLRTEGRERWREKRGVGYVLLGIVIAIPLLFVVIGLLASADVLFGQIADRIFTDHLFALIHPGNLFELLFRGAASFLAAYLLLAHLCRHTLREEVVDHRHGEPILAVTVTGLLTAVYLLFSVIQILGLFLGRLQLPEGYTYARYAREGFFQLLAVSILNLVLVLVCLSFFRKSRALRGVLCVMSLCTYIMIASSAMRMILYIKSYDLTFLRILVLWTLALLAILFAGVLASIFSEGFLLFRYSMVAVTVLYLGLSYSHPDYLIARVNVRNAVIDYRYLSGLSADAAPVLIPFAQEQGCNISAFYSEHNSSGQRSDPIGFGYYYLRSLREATAGFGIRSYNVSRHIALRTVRRVADGAARDGQLAFYRQEDGISLIVCEERVYVPYCAVTPRDCGTLLGCVDGDAQDKVYAYRDYPPEEWIIDCYRDMADTYMLWRALETEEIPEGLWSEYPWNTQ